MWLLEASVLSDAIKAYSAKGGELSTKFPFSKDKEKLLQKIVSSSNDKGPLYRGQWYTEKQWDAAYETFLTDGSVFKFNLPLVSFSRDKSRVSSYGKGGQVFVKFIIKGNCTGLDISSESIYLVEQEVLVADNKFKVINSDMPRMGSFEIEIKEV